jgi:hypothetical protein
MADFSAGTIFTQPLVLAMAARHNNNNIKADEDDYDDVCVRMISQIIK